jgi:YegS/Rv2252/BmrU family lipid kinase
MTLKKVLLFYNPHAGNDIFSNKLDLVVSEFQKKNQIVVPLRADGHDILERFFDTFDASEYTRIIAAGGDGTVNIVVNAMVKHDIHVPLAILPAGTANDLAHYFDLPDEIETMLEIATGDRYTDMDVGVANGRCFVNVMAMGMMVDVSQKTDKLAKNTMGIMAYYLRGLAEVPKLKSIPATITCPEFKKTVDMYAMIIMNGRSAGGFKRTAPSASINDGLLDVIVFKDMGIAKLAGVALEVLTGQHTSNDRVLYFQTSELNVESKDDVATDMDGEAGPLMPLEVRLLPKRLKICTLENDMEGNVW